MFKRGVPKRSAGSSPASATKHLKKHNTMPTPKEIQKALEAAQQLEQEKNIRKTTFKQLYDEGRHISGLSQEEWDREFGNFLKENPENLNLH
jgi:hypothetical protein